MYCTAVEDWADRQVDLVLSLSALGGKSPEFKSCTSAAPAGLPTRGICVDSMRLRYVALRVLRSLLSDRRYVFPL